MPDDPTLTTTVTRKQWEVLLLEGFDLKAESLHGGIRRIWWPLSETPRIFWHLDASVPRHARRAIPYRCLQVALFKAMRSGRAHGAW